jgi:hypothetical protein
MEVFFKPDLAVAHKNKIDWIINCYYIASCVESIIDMILQRSWLAHFNE